MFDVLTSWKSHLDTQSPRRYTKVKLLEETISQQLCLATQAAGADAADDVSVKSAKSTRSLSSLKARALRKLSRKAKKGKKVAVSDESAKSSKSVAGDDASDKSAVSSTSKATKEEKRAIQMFERRVSRLLTKQLRRLARENGAPCLGNFWELEVEFTRHFFEYVR